MTAKAWLTCDCCGTRFGPREDGWPLCFVRDPVCNRRQYGAGRKMGKSALHQVNRNVHELRVECQLVEFLGSAGQRDHPHRRQRVKNERRGALQS